MNVTDEMVAAFRAAPVPDGWKFDELLRVQLQAVLDVVAPPEPRRECGRRQDGALMCRPANECPDCPLTVVGGSE